MLKKNKGITMIVLVMTILLLIILTGVSVNTGYSVVKDIKIGRIISDMSLVKAKTETIYEQWQFSGNDADLVGQEVTIDFLSAEEIELIEQNAGNSDFTTWKWYQWDVSTLQTQGLDPTLLSGEEYFYVNYEHSEILYSKGTSYKKGTKYYSMTGLNDLYQNS